jgi:hypothetical protein
VTISANPALVEAAICDPWAPHSFAVDLFVAGRGLTASSVPPPPVRSAQDARCGAPYAVAANEGGLLLRFDCYPQLGYSTATFSIVSGGAGPPPLHDAGFRVCPPAGRVVCPWGL